MPNTYYAIIRVHLSTNRTINYELILYIDCKEAQGQGSNITTWWKYRKTRAWVTFVIIAGKESQKIVVVISILETSSCSLDQPIPPTTIYNHNKILHPFLSHKTWRQTRYTIPSLNSPPPATPPPQPPPLILTCRMHSHPHHRPQPEPPWHSSTPNVK